MASSSTISESPQAASISAGLAKSLAPEDVRAGDYVAMLHEIYELPSFLWSCDASLLPADELVRLQTIASGGGTPLKVKAVCLPFLLVKHPSRGTRPIDVRRFRLARLDREYARAAWQALRPPRKGKRKGRK